MVAVVLFAMLAAFVALRLYSVLGRRTGHEQPVPKPGELVTAPPALAPRARAEPVRDGGDAGELIGPGAVDGIRAIVAADPSFDVLRFVGGARSAYGMILEAFWRGDEADLGRLAEGEVLEAFHHAIAERTGAGHALENRLVAIERAEIERASITAGIAAVTVRFDADVAAVTRDRDGTVIAGSMTDAVQTHDLWTFSRAVKSRDPNWILTETDEAA